MKPITGVLKIHTRNILFWFVMPWLILLASLSINLFVGLLLGGKSPIYTGGLTSIYVYMFITGVLILRDTFPFALGFSVRRVDYVLGTLLMLLLSSLLHAFLLGLFALIETQTTYWGVNVHFFHLPYLSDGSWFEQLWVYFVPLLHLFLLGFVISSIYRRFGSTGMWIFTIVVLLLVSSLTLLWTYLRWWGNLSDWLGQFTAFEMACWLFVLALMYAGMAYALLRKATF